MKRQSFENRVATIIDAVKKASPGDFSIGIGRTSKGDGLDLLVDAIDDLLRRSRESVTAFQSAQEVMLKLQIAGAKGAEEELSWEHVLLMDTLKENIPDTIYFKDARSRFISLSKAHVKAFNLVDKREVVGKTDFDFFMEEHAREAFEDEQRIMRTGEPIINKEEKETWSDRPATWVLTTKMPLHDQKGHIVGTFGISRDITMRKRAEEALRKSEERYRLLFNSINDAVFVHGITAEGLPGKITEVNDFACERLGYARDVVLRMSPLDFVAPESAAIAPEIMARLKAERFAVWEGIHVSQAGRRIPVEISTHLFDMAGEPTIITTARDISRRKQLEDNLEKEKTLLLTLINNLPDYVSVKDKESRFLVTNTANARFMGLEKAQDAVGKTDLDFYPPPEAARYLADERIIVQTGTPLINKEEESPDQDGRQRWTLTTKVPIRNAQGRVVGIVCTGRDITERKRAEEALQESEEKYRISENKYRNLVELAPEGISVVDNARVIFFNNHLLEMLGYSYEEMMGMEIAKIIHKDDVGGAMKRYSARTEGEILPKTIFRDVRKDGEIIWVETVGQRIEWEGRHAVLYFSSDVTERKILEEQFTQAQKMDAIGQLTGGIAHDFNNVIQVIIGYCELLIQSVPDASKKHLEQVTLAAKRGAALTAQLLAFSRKQILRPRVVDTKDLIRSVQKMLARVIGEDIELWNFNDPNTGNFLADPGQMEQVLMNLAVNARDAMPSGGKLTIETSNRTFDEAYVHDHPEAKAGQYVCIAVSDTGGGMDRETLSHIFEPFFTTKERGKGTGLGLSTVYGIIKQSEGYINCYSELGRGTTFTIYLPLIFGEADKSLVAVSGRTAPRGTETILLVDDDSAVRSVARIALEEAGYRVIEASGGEEALAAVAAQSLTAALLVTDVVMPRMSGKELYRRLQELFPKMRVLYVSGYTANVISHHGILEAGLDFLQKPFSAIEFLTKVREIFDKP